VHVQVFCANFSEKELEAVECATDCNETTKPGLCGCIVPDTETDGDGTPDCNESCPRDDSEISPGACGCGIPDTDTDTDGDGDGDGSPDCKHGCPHNASTTSSGTCDCGIPDNNTVRDGTPYCKDDCPRDANKMSSGACNHGTTNNDTVGDGTPNGKDGCRHDASKMGSSICRCAIPDTDMDKDSTPNCIGRCPPDATKTKTSYSTCGCSVSDTDADQDGTPNCRSDCNYDDPSILSIPEETILRIPNLNCEGCDGEYYTSWKECCLLCLSSINRCINYSLESLCVLVNSVQGYQDQSYYEKLNQTGIDSSNTMLEAWNDCDLAECAEYIGMN